MVVPNRIENPNAQLPPGPGTLTITEKEYTGGAQGISSTTPVQITGTQQIFALSGTQDVMFIGFASAAPNAQLIANVGFGINVDGVDYYGTLSATPNLGGNVEGGLFVSKGLSLGPGNHTVYLFAYRISGLYNAGSIISSVTLPTRWEAIFGGGTDTPNEPVVGGSGTQYLTIADAILGETETRVAAVVPQAGTGPGLVVGPGTLSAVNDFYKDWFVVNTDTTPSNGLVAQFARVSSYDGPTRTLTIDKPWNFSAESDFLLVDPVRLTLKQDVTEDVTVNKCAVMDLGGNRIKGKVDVTASEFCWIRGANAFITNGVQKADFGALKIDKCTISRRDATIYALLMTEGSNLGRCEIKDCEFMGRVAGRRGYSGWMVKNCKNLGVASNSNFDNLPFTLVESIAGVAITLTAFDIDVDSEMAGAWFYSENSITGATAYISAQGEVKACLDYFDMVPTSRSFHIARGLGNCTLTITHTSGVTLLTFSTFRGPAVTANISPRFGVLAAESMTGTAQFSTNIGLSLNVLDFSTVILVTVEGTSDTSGAVTLGGSGTLNISTPNATVMVARLGGVAATGAGKLTGTLTVSVAAITVTNGGVQMLAFLVNHDAGAPVLQISSVLTFRCGFGFTIVNTSVNISVGTWTISGAMLAHVQIPPIFSLASGVSGGTWAFSGTIYCKFHVEISSSYNIFSAGATGGTVTISGLISLSAGDQPGITSANMTFLNVQGAISITVSGNVTVMWLSSTAAVGAQIVRCDAAGGTAVASGTFRFFNCWWGAAIGAFVRVTNGNVTGPVAIELDHCTVFGAVTMETNTGGVLTWTGASFKLRHCHIDGLLTGVATRFSTIEFFHTRFNGNASNKAITLTGTRPTTLRYWKCSFAARCDDLQPEVLDVYDILPAQAALVQGQPVKVNAANQYQVCVAASIVDGVALAAAGGAGTILIALRQGRTYVTCKAGTANGDNLVLDLVTPTQANQGAFLAGQEIGTALEAVGAVVAGKCYTAVNVR